MTILTCEETIESSRDLERIMVNARKAFPNAEFQIDRELRLYEHLLYDNSVPIIGTERKPVTLRFAKGKIRMPFCSELTFGRIQVIATRPDDDVYRKIAGEVIISPIIIAHAKDMPMKVILADGYETREKMMKDISDIYKCEITPETILSAYYFASFFPHKSYKKA